MKKPRSSNGNPNISLEDLAGRVKDVDWNAWFIFGAIILVLAMGVYALFAPDAQNKMMGNPACGKIVIAANGPTLNANVSGTLQEAMYFLVVNPLSGKMLESVRNPYRGLAPSAQIAYLVASKGEEAVIVGNIDQQSYNILMQFGIRTFGGYTGKSKDVVKLYRQARITAIPTPNTLPQARMNPQLSIPAGQAVFAPQQPYNPYAPLMQGAPSYGVPGPIYGGAGVGLGPNCPLPMRQAAVAQQVAMAQAAMAQAAAMNPAQNPNGPDENAFGKDFPPMNINQQAAVAQQAAMAQAAMAQAAAMNPAQNPNGPDENAFGKDLPPMNINQQAAAAQQAAIAQAAMAQAAVQQAAMAQAAAQQAAVQQAAVQQAAVQQAAAQQAAMAQAAIQQAAVRQAAAQQAAMAQAAVRQAAAQQAAMAQAAVRQAAAQQAAIAQQAAMAQQAAGIAGLPDADTMARNNVGVQVGWGTGQQNMNQGQMAYQPGYQQYQNGQNNYYIQPDATNRGMAPIAAQVPVTETAPPIMRNSPMPHAYRGSCINCHQVLDPNAATQPAAAANQMMWK